MLQRLLILAVPCLLIADVSASPRQLRNNGASSQSCERVTETVTVTVTRTASGSDLQTTEALASVQSGRPVLTEQHSPVGTLSAIYSSDNAPTIELTQTPSTTAQDGGPQASPPPASSVAGIFGPDAVHSSATPAGTGSNLSPSGNDSTVHPRPSKYKNVVYFTNWGIYGANYQPQQLPASQITHVLYAFADIAPDGEVKTSDSYADLEKHYPTDSWNDQGNNAYGCIKQLYLLKKKNRSMKVLLSIGGWTYSPKFAPIAATESGRQRFASSALTLVKDWGFDGIDIDWEYPSNADEAQNFVLLLQACRQAFDQYAAQNAPGYHFLITIASPAGPQNYKNMDFAGMDPWVDAWNLMAYDYAGSWDSTTGHQANIYASTSNPTATKFNTEQAVCDYIAKGIPVDKIIMGLPLYGRSFEATTGLGQPYNGIGDGSIQSGVWLYRDLPRAGAQEAYDDSAKASYSYDPATKELVSYDTVSSAVTKAQYLLQKGLGGAVFWEASGDRTGASSLVGTLATQMGALDATSNLLSYPASRYDNIRAGMPGE